MVKRHLNRLNAPKTWPIKKKKGIRFIARPLPGAHSLKQGITLSIVVRDILNYAKTAKELKTILNSGKILVNKEVRKTPRFSLGLMDIIEIPETKESYVLLLNKKNKFYLQKNKNSNEKICKIKGKTLLKKGKVQLNLLDGINLIVDKDVFKVGDSVVLDLQNHKIKKHLKLEKGATIFLVSGKHLGSVGVVEDIQQSEFEKPKLIFKTKKEKFETLKEYAFVINGDMIDEGHKD